MTPPPRPSRVAAAVLRLLTSRDRADAIIGDIDEDRARRAPHGGFRSKLWVEWQAWRFIVSAIRSHVPLALRAFRFVGRDAWRSIRSAPAASLFMLVILTVGIGAATVTFSVVDAVVLRPLPFPNPRQLVAVEFQDSRPGAVRVTSLSAFQFAAVRDAAQPIGPVAATTGSTEILVTGGQPEPIVSARVTASLFDVLGVPPLLGQTFAAANEAPGTEAVAVIGHDLWRRRFDADPGIVGRTIELAVRGRQTVETRAVTVLGVMPPGFAYPLTHDVRPEIWTPYVVPDDERGSSTGRYLHVVGRLASGVSGAQAQARVDAVMAGLLSASPGAVTDDRLVVRRLDDAIFGPVRSWMLLALLAVGLVMLVSCANVANLMLSRTTRRARELSVRASIGASRRHLVASLLAESLLLSLAAAALGLLVAVWGVEAARSALPSGITRLRDVALDLRVLAATIGVAVATGLVFGAVPAWQAARTDLVTLLKSGSPPGSWGRRRWRSAFLVAQIAFIGVLLVSSSLFVASFVRVTRADLGFDRSDVVEVRASDLAGQLSDVLRDLAAVPGVASAAALAAADAPLVAAGFGGGSSSTTLRRAGAPGQDAALSAAMFRVSPDYFETMGVGMLSGRTFLDGELGKGEAIVLDEVAARTLFASGEGLGARLTYGQGTTATVVGIVANVRMRGPGDPSGPQVYLPARATAAGHVFIVRTELATASLAPAADVAFARHRKAGAAPVGVRRLEDAFRNITADRRFAAGLMSLFGLFALAIGAAGIYAVMSSTVAQQTREFGIRIALGASGAAIVGFVLERAVRQLALGLALGLPAGWAMARIFASLLFEVQPSDATVSLVVIAAIAGVGLVAALIPAGRAARVDPMITLKMD